MHHPRHSGLSGVKRRYPLMLNENPSKKSKAAVSSSSEGPTIHELDNAEVVSDDLFTEETDSLGQVCMSFTFQLLTLLYIICNISLFQTGK